MGEEILRAFLLKVTFGHFKVDATYHLRQRNEHM